jgi:hypothetical protein
MKKNNKITRLFWWMDQDKLNLENDRNLLIHQVLAYGSLDDYCWLKKKYSKNIIKKEFQKSRGNIYVAPVFYFFKTILGIKRIDKKKYIK